MCRVRLQRLCLGGQRLLDTILMGRLRWLDPWALGRPAPLQNRMADRVGAMADLDPIWRDDRDILGAKVNVSPMILYGLTLC